LVVASRLAGYAGAPLPGRYAEVELEPFTPADVTAYVDAWQMPAPVRAGLAGRLADPAIAGMARVPLLLAMLCDLALAGEELPATRAGLYNRMLRRFLRAEQRGTDAEGRAEEQRLLDLLPPLAAHFADTPAGWVDRMPGDHILAVLRTAPGFAELQADPAEVLDRLSAGAGVLVPAGDARRGADPPYLFAHRTLAEYLTAAHLAAAGDGWREAVTEHVWFDPDWEQVIPLLGALLAEPEQLLPEFRS
jgi:hypothetical protein